jgi:hypothetical protein
LEASGGGNPNEPKLKKKSGSKVELSVESTTISSLVEN